MRANRAFCFDPLNPLGKATLANPIFPQFSLLEVNSLGREHGSLCREPSSQFPHPELSTFPTFDGLLFEKKVPRTCCVVLFLFASSETQLFAGKLTEVWLFLSERDVFLLATWYCYSETTALSEGLCRILLHFYVLILLCFNIKACHDPILRRYVFENVRVVFPKLFPKFLGVVFCTFSSLHICILRNFHSLNFVGSLHTKVGFLCYTALLTCTSTLYSCHFFRTTGGLPLLPRRFFMDLNPAPGIFLFTSRYLY